MGWTSDRRPSERGGHPPSAERLWQRAATSVLTLVALAVATSACGTSGPTPTAPAGARVALQASRPVQHATRMATLVYQQCLTRAGAAFTTDLKRLATAVRAGDAAAARQAELAAQGDEDAFRAQIGAGTATALALDGRPADLAPGDTLTGLHLVERDLWKGGGDPLPAVQALLSEGPAVEELLSRVKLSPAAIARSGVETLGWVNDAAISGREETFSRLDTVDTAAGVAAARSTFTAVAPLGALVAPAETAVPDGRFAGPARAVAALGSPSELTDMDAPAGAEAEVAREVDATAAALSTLAASLATVSPTSAYAPTGRQW